MDKQEQVKAIQEAKQAIKELSPEILREDTIRDNCIEFPIGSELYRVRMPNNRERNDADKKKQREYLKLRRDPDYITRAQLRELHKESGIDTDMFDNKIKVLGEQIEQLYDRMSEITSENIKGIDSLDKKINDRIEEIQKLSIEKAELLANCIEEEVYATFLENLIVTCTEKLTNEETGKDPEWQKVWISQDEFDNDNNMVLSQTAIVLMSKLFASLRGF